MTSRTAIKIDDLIEKLQIIRKENIITGDIFIKIDDDEILLREVRIENKLIILS